MSTEHCRRLAHASVLNMSEVKEASLTLSMLALFDLFMMSIAGGNGERFFGWHVRVKHLNMEKCTLMRSSPKAFSLYVRSGTVICDRRCMSEGACVHQEAVVWSPQ